jgi:hypothetical protein
MVTVVLVFCVAWFNGTCGGRHYERIDVDKSVCLTVQPQIWGAQETADHPKWRFEGWHCETGESGRDG